MEALNCEMNTANEQCLDTYQSSQSLLPCQCIKLSLCMTSTGDQHAGLMQHVSLEYSEEKEDDEFKSEDLTLRYKYMVAM